MSLVFKESTKNRVERVDYCKSYGRQDLADCDKSEYRSKTNKQKISAALCSEQEQGWDRHTAWVLRMKEVQ